MMHTDANLDFC